MTCTHLIFFYSCNTHQTDNFHQHLMHEPTRVLCVVHGLKGMALCYGSGVHYSLCQASTSEAETISTRRCQEIEVTHHLSVPCRPMKNALLHCCLNNASVKSFSEILNPSVKKEIKLNPNLSCNDYSRHAWNKLLIQCCPEKI